MAKLLCLLGLCVGLLSQAFAVRLTGPPRQRQEQKPRNLLQGGGVAGDAEAAKRHARLDLLRGCGEVCDSTPGRFPTTRGKYFDQVRKHVDCEGLFSNVADDAAATEWPPPKEVPALFKQDYTMGGFVQVRPMWFAQRYDGGNASGSIKDLTTVWERQYVDALVVQARKGDYSGNLSRAYGPVSTGRLHRLLRKHADLVTGKHFFVIGSERPWLEALLLEVGAKRVTTIEYGKIKPQHPQLDALTPEELRVKLIASKGKEPRFDGGASFSSIEHSGLGRYGDRLNPWADLQTVAKAWCYTDAKGPLFLGVPSGVPDTLFWNAHRVYGPLRWPHLTANWEQMDSEEGPVFGKPESTYQHTLMFRRLGPLPALQASGPTSMPGAPGGPGAAHTQQAPIPTTAPSANASAAMAAASAKMGLPPAAAWAGPTGPPPQPAAGLPMGPPR